ncbi:hypothetical protein [Streptomyces sp.]|uniref:hypothetical protein n=1 Tax=Streptomyces sp. TaxID=1931 RepID=UPI002D78140A|nr:hypothetical protein [Streptomyces sp.]HET6357242.1 hypothetical protein [Streptomyces sp.]
MVDPSDTRRPPRIVIARSPLALTAVAALLLGASACTTDKGGKEATDDAVAEDSTCNELLGEAGLKWLKERMGGKARLKVIDDLERARALFYRQVVNWGPEDTGARTFQRADVCLARTDVTDSRKQLEIRYGPSYFTFDAPFDKASEASPAQTVTRVNSAVKLVHGKDRDGIVRSRVYVKCKIPGTPAKQENDIPIEGQLTDTLTGDTGARVHLTHLLHSAKVMADTLDCQNKPDVPAEPPASLK